jgi:hypothetical protein
MKNFHRRQARWALELAAFDFVIFHRRSKDNPADRPSRRPDYAMMDLENENPLQDLIQSRMRQEDPLDADHVEKGDSYSVGVLTRGATRAATP